MASQNNNQQLVVVSKSGEQKRAENTEALRDACECILKGVGEDIEREGLQRTPLRMAKALLELTSGYHKKLDDIVGEALFQSDARDMVIVSGIPFHSLCEHHVLPFVGVAHVGYMPKGKVLGLSKFARIVDMYSRRLQIQEQLTTQIAEALESILHSFGVAVCIEATHMCMEMRGARSHGSCTRSTAFTGVFDGNLPLRQEFLDACNKSRNKA